MTSLDDEHILLQRALQSASDPWVGTINPPDHFLQAATFSYDPVAEKPLPHGTLCCIIVAGGQGSRLGIEGAKALLPVTRDGENLLELRLRQLKRFAHEVQRPLFVAIMTSIATHAAIQSYLEHNGNFGIEELHLFMQGSLPLLHPDGSPFGNARGPDGNGWLFHWFDKAHLFERCASLDVQTLSVIFIDNPLADPFHPEMVYQHVKNGAESTWAAVRRISPEEKVGLFVEHDGKLEVIEYSELDNVPHAVKKRLTLANISQFLIECTAAISIKDASLPLHIAHKTHEKQPVLKFERFIFDILPLLNHCQIVEIDRTRYFHPIKNQHDLDTLLKEFPPSIHNGGK